jgi:hypothetical protein
LQTNSKIDYELAIKGYVFELAIIALIILIIGLKENINEFIESSEMLDESHFSTLNSFFSFCENKKVYMPLKIFEIYNEFLKDYNNQPFLSKY